MAFAGLYGDLPSAKDQADAAEKKEKKEGWAGSGLFAPANLAAKRQAALAPPSVLRAAAAGGRGRGREGPPPVALGGRGGGSRGGGPTTPSAAKADAGGGGGGMLLAAASSGDGPITITATAAPTYAGMSLGEDIKDEYDPSKPNDYDAVRRAREQQRRDAELEAARQERLREEQERERERQRREEERRREEEERLREMRELEALELAAAGDAAGGEPPASAAAQRGGQQGPAAPDQQQGEEQRRAALALSGEEAWKRRGMAAQPAGGGEGWEPGGLGLGGLAGGGLGGLGGGGGLGFGGGVGAAGGPGGQPKGMSLAQRMLEKMGWKEGEGLGRNRQGMATPLMMQKVDVRTGVIVNAAPSATSQPAAAAAAAGGEQPAKRQRAATFNRPPTRVVLLTNMIGPGEVDKELDREVGEECSKYGSVTNVMIFEVTEPGFPSDQSVRIFVQFERVEEATKALVDLQGRFFGGREVEAQFFEEERFEKLELAPRPEEVRR